MTVQPIVYRYTSTKEYIEAFPVAYRQWRDTGKCSILHGYALTIKFYFGTNELDIRNWCVDYGSLRPLKSQLEDWFDHRVLVTQDDPMYNEIKRLGDLKLAKITEVEKTGCEGLADWLYKWMNTCYIPDTYGKAESERVWCYRVEVRETQANMAFREGHREWNEDLFA